MKAECLISLGIALVVVVIHACFVEVIGIPSGYIFLFLCVGGAISTYKDKFPGPVLTAAVSYVFAHGVIIMSHHDPVPEYMKNCFAVFPPVILLVILFTSRGKETWLLSTYVSLMLEGVVIIGGCSFLFQYMSVL